MMASDERPMTRADITYSLFFSTSVEPRTGLEGIVRIRWDARDKELSADGGIPLERQRTPTGGPPILRGP